VKRIAWRGGVTIGAVLLLVGGAAGAARAQTVDVRVTVPKQTVQEVRAAIERALSEVLNDKVWADVQREIAVAIREGLIGAEQAAKDASDIIREVRREVSRSVTTGGGWQDRNYSQEQIDKASHTLQIGPTGSLQLKNLSGDVTVTAGTGRAATVEVIRKSRGRTLADAKLGLDRVKVEVDQRGERASVTARYPDESRPPYAVSINYIVTAPAGTSLTISTLSGDVHVSDIKGDVAIDVASGDVVASKSQVSSVKTMSGDVTVTDAQGDGRLEFSTMSGTIKLERVRAKRLGVTVLSGDVIVRDIEAGDVEIGSTNGDVEFSGVLSKTGRYDIHSHNGDVRVSVPKSGFDLNASTFSGDITADASLGMKSASNSRRSLRGTVGDGGAALTVKTFSGDIIVTRK
jgi:hypothetical protein